jgi:hypothetical protein
VIIVRKELIKDICAGCVRDFFIWLEGEKNDKGNNPKDDPKGGTPPLS